MLEMWRAFYEIGDGDGPETTRAKIADRLLLMDESFREVLPFVFDLFGVPDPANPSSAIDPEQRQKRIHGVLKRILHDPAYGGLRVILLEDLHWFDGASDAYVETTVESVTATHDLLLITFRPEYQARWIQRSYYQQLPLQPLDPEAIRALLRGQLCWLGTWRRRRPLPRGRCRSPVRTRNAVTRRMPCTSSARLRRDANLQKASRPEITTARRSPWPTSSACVRFRPTATLASVPCMPSSAVRRQLVRSYPPSSYTGRWR
jgi:hypothetical protein